MRVTASGICASDVDAVNGKYPAAMYQFPMVAGHEGSVHRSRGVVFGVTFYDYFTGDGAWG